MEVLNARSHFVAERRFPRDGRARFSSTHAKRMLRPLTGGPVSAFYHPQPRASGQVSWKVTALCRRDASCKSTETRRSPNDAYDGFFKNP